METRCGGLFFTSKFDSGNLARVEKVGKDEEEGDNGGNHFFTGGEIKPDYEFNCWTKPDMGGTQFENGNRSWFYFGVRGGGAGRLIKINIVNMNRQGKLYSQGHSPIVKTVPGKPKWDRIRDRPTYETVDGQFILSFTHRFLDVKGATTYFAFCYPWTYAESQTQMAQLAAKFEKCKDYNSQTSPDKIYYHRELLCESLDRLRIDLLTITDCHGMSDEQEPHFDGKLFPDKTAPRCKMFKNKRVYLVSSRVHPGETPASHVYNGLLEFLLREDDPRARQLRRQYVFKLIPMLNPDGVVRGHYRTDSRGVNLNRMYLDPDFSLYPSIYASKALLVYHHVQNRVPATANATPRVSSNASVVSEKSTARTSKPPPSSEPPPKTPVVENTGIDKSKNFSVVHQESSQEELVTQPLSCMSLTSESYEMDGLISGNELAASGGECQDSEDEIRAGSRIGNEGSDDDDGERYPPVSSGTLFAPHLSDPKLREIPHDKSGIAMYVDLHAHASKRGCFIYGNYYEDEETQMENMLFSKLCSINTAHFDFTACNFTERNMYLKDKREGLSKEGAGRVALYKALGIIHSYTLECNYNTGRMVNSVPSAYNDSGRATPPPLAGFPPKYRPEHYEDVGRALLVSMLDITETNPWSRLTLSEHCSLHGVKEYVRRFIRGLRGLPKGAPNRPQRAAMKAAAAASAGSAQANAQAGRGNAASNNSPLKSSSMTSTKATPIPRVATLSRSSTSTANARSQGGATVHRTSSLGSQGRGSGVAGSQGAAVNQSTRVPAPPPGGGSGRGRTTPQAWGRGRELPSVKEGSQHPRPGHRHTATSTAPPANKPIHHSMSAPVPLTLTNSSGTDIKCLSGDSLSGPCKPPSTPPSISDQQSTTTSRQTSMDADSIHSMEEEKLQQLKNLPGFSRNNAMARAAKPLEPPNIQIEFAVGENREQDDRSDPVKRKNKRGGAGSKIRRSSSHSPKSAKAGAPRKLGTINSGVDTDFERKTTTKARRRKSMGSRLNSNKAALAAARQRDQQQAMAAAGMDDNSSADADSTGADLSSSAVRITPRVASQQVRGCVGGSSVGGFLSDGPPPLILLPTPPATPTHATHSRRHKASSHKRGARAALEMKRDIERITARLAEQRIKRVLQHHLDQQQQVPADAFWIDY